MTEPNAAPLLEPALQYARDGLFLFPAKVREVDGEKKLFPIGDWDGQSTNDPMRLRIWFGPNGIFRAEVLCIDCRKSDLAVIDVDSVNHHPGAPDGLGNWAEFCKQHNIGGTWIVHTPSGGQHWYFRADPNRHVGIDSSGKVAVGVDVRGAGGLVVAPPSVDYRGQFRWGAEGVPDWPSLPVVPTAVVDAMNGKQTRRKQPSGTDADKFFSGAGQPRRFTFDQAVEFCRTHIEALKTATVGTRNDTLNSTALVLSHFVPQFWSRAQAESILLQTLDPAYPVDEAQATIDSAFSATDWVAERVEPPVVETPTSTGGPTPLAAASAPRPLPTDCLGDVFGPMVAAVSESYQVPSDLVITYGLPLVSIAMRGQWKVRVGPDWVETCAIATVGVAESGERKSPVMRALSAPLREYEKEVRAEQRQSIATAAAKYELRKKGAEKLRDAAVKNPGSSEEQQYVEAQRELADMEIPNALRFFLDDVTMERLGRILDEQGGSAGIYSAEPVMISIASGRYSGGRFNLETPLKAISGDPIQIDRQSSPAILVDDPCLSVAMALQPGLLPDLGEGTFRVSGFLARFLFAMPEPMVGSRDTEERPIPTDVSDGWGKALRLVAEYARTFEAKRRERGGEPVMLGLSPAAKELHTRFRAALEPTLKPNTGQLAAISDWGAKAPGHVVRVAAALTVLDNPESVEIDGEHMGNAIRLIKAYIPHVQSVFARCHATDGSIAAAEDVLAWLTSKQLKTFTVRDVFRGLHGRGWVSRADDVKAALRTLEEYDHVRLLPEAEPKKGRPAERYELHPSHLNNGGKA